MGLEEVILGFFKEYGPFALAVVAIFLFYNRALNDQVKLLKDLLMNERNFSTIKVSELGTKIDSIRESLNTISISLKGDFTTDHGEIQSIINAIRDTVNRIEVEVRQ